jgi:hypothetical protein
MHLDRLELQLLLVAARGAAYAARAEQERHQIRTLTSPEAFERLAVRLENELVRTGAGAVPPGSAA